MSRRFSLPTLLSLALVAGGTVAYAQAEPHAHEPVGAEGIAIQQRLGSEIARDARFRDEAGRPVTLGSYLGNRPVLVLPIEFDCPAGCNAIRDSLLRVLAKAGRRDEMRLGRDLDVVLLSVDPTEDSALSARQKKELASAIDVPTYYNPLRGLEPKRPPSQPNLGRGLHLLTGTRDQILKATDSLGWTFRYNGKDGVAALPTGAAFVSPQGRIVGYSLGNELVTRFVEDGLANAAQNRPGPAADPGQRYACVKVGAAALRNRPWIRGLLQGVGVLTLLVLGSSIFWMSLRYRTPQPPRS